MIGQAAMVFLAAMLGGWLARHLMIERLRVRHPGQFAALGSPTSRQLSSLLPRYRETQLRFWKYLWGGDAFKLGDARLSRLAAAAIAADVLLVASMVVLFATASAPQEPPKTGGNTITTIAAQAAYTGM